MERYLLQWKSNALFWLLSLPSCHMSYFMSSGQLVTAAWRVLFIRVFWWSLVLLETHIMGNKVSPQWCWWESPSSFGDFQRTPLTAEGFWSLSFQSWSKFHVLWTNHSFSSNFTIFFFLPHDLDYPTSISESSKIVRNIDAGERHRIMAF